MNTRFIVTGKVVGGGTDITPNNLKSLILLN